MAAAAHWTNLLVEISGWDDDKRFFVEKSDLEWDAAGRRTVLLHSRLHTGSMVFVRLVANRGSAKGYPVGHRVERIETSSERAFRVCLAESQPAHSAGRDATNHGLEHLIGIDERTRS